ncbi:hypothetical protein SLE2022_089240 [Rubroshorea leprosula]
MGKVLCFGNITGLDVLIFVIGSQHCFNYQWTRTSQLLKWENGEIAHGYGISNGDANLSRGMPRPLASWKNSYRRISR